MKIAAYCRVSTDKEEQLDSLHHQKEFFVEYARRNGHQLYRLYADEGISGTSLKKREEFKRLMLDAELGLFQMVAVKDVSRFARNTVDALQSIRKLKAMGINTLFLTANMDTMGDSEFIITLFSAMAQEESNNLSKRVKWGKKINAEKGRVPQRIFGYDRIDNFTLTVNGDEARIIRKIFSLYIQQGLGCRTISMALNRENDKTKYGADWNARAVRRILVNPLYCGVLINHKYEIEDFLTGKQVGLPEEQHFRHDRPDWAIITADEFQQAQAIMASRRKKYDSGAPFREGRYSSKHIFSTLIKCQHCGRSFCRKSYIYANTRSYWKCVTNDQYTAERCDNLVKLEEPELLDALSRYFADAIGDMDAFVAGVLSGLEQATPKTEDPQAVKREFTARRDRMLARRSRYQDMYADALLTMADLKVKLEKVDKELATIEDELRQLDSAGERQSKAQQHTKNIEKFLRLENVTNVDIRKVIDRILVNKKGEVRVVFRPLRIGAGAGGAGPHGAVIQSAGGLRLHRDALRADAAAAGYSEPV